jgi:uncharacterized lipoprotein YbaY
MGMRHAGWILGWVVAFSAVVLWSWTPRAAEAGGSVSLEGPVWQWQGTQLSDGSRFTPTDPGAYTVQFVDETRVAARLDCNRSIGSYTATERLLTITLGATTLAACPPGSLDRTFSRQLGLVSSYWYSGSDLIMELAVDSGTMRFSPGAAPERAAPSPTPLPPRQSTLTGTVTYRERIALPPDAIVEVRLEDVSRADAPAIVVAEQTITSPGQVPIAFSLSYDPSAIEERFTYAVRARITDASGRLLFITTTMNRVLTRGAPTDGVELVLQRVGGP